MRWFAGGFGSGLARDLTFHARRRGAAQFLQLRIVLDFALGLRTNVGVDIFNIINAAPGLSYNENFIANGPWLTPTTVMTARFAKFSA